MAHLVAPAVLLPAWVTAPDTTFLAALGLLAALAVVALAIAVRRAAAVWPARNLLGDLARPEARLVVFARGLFVPSGEFFSRAPGDPRDPAAQVTVHKWGHVPEVYNAADMRAFTDVARLALGINPGLLMELTAGEPTRQPWNDHCLAVGPHYRALQILDACQPRLMAYRSPNAFRGVESQDLFEARDGSDYGLVYKGRHPASHRSCWVVMGLGDPGTEAAASFLRRQARALGRLTGGGPFAAVVQLEPGRSRESAVLRSLQPRPSWWRRLLFRRSWRELTAGMRPPAAARRPGSG